MYIPIESILVDELLYPRNELAWREVQRYISALATGAEFPPIVVGKRDGKYVVIDGRHRYEAFKRAKKAKIPALPTKLSEEKWFAEAVRLNTIHGHPLSYQERLAAAMILKRQKFTLEEIEKVVAIQTEQLEKAIQQRGTWIHPEDVKPVVLKASIAGVAESRGRRWLEKEAKNLDTKQEKLSGQNPRELVKQLRTLLDNDLVSDDDLEGIVELKNSIEKWLLVRASHS